MPQASSATWMRWLSLRGYVLVTSALFGAGTPPLVMRRRFELLGATPRATLQRRYPKLKFGDHAVGRLAIESIRAAAAPARAILYLHGGGYFMGSPASYRRRAMRLSFRCAAEVFVPDYRLAPEHPYPAALDDALAAWRWLRRTLGDQSLHVVGDSAGGGLALALLLRLRDLGEPLPDAAVLLSPWTDLTASGASVDTNRGRDLWFTRAHLQSWARYVIGGSDPNSPYLSPAFGSLAGLPPLMLLVGEDELLLDDALRVHRAATSAGIASELLVGSAMQHDWPLALPWLPESRQAWQRMARFLRSQLLHEPRSRGAVRCGWGVR
jgi:acetyl esterase/lipase